MLAGLIGPLCVALYGWRAGLFVTAAGMAVLAVILQPLVPRLDRNRGAKGATRPSMLTTMRGIVRDRAMRGLALSQAAYVGLQNTFFTFFVTFLVVQLGHDLVTAGQTFAESQFVAVPARELEGKRVG